MSSLPSQRLTTSTIVSFGLLIGTTSALYLYQKLKRSNIDDRNKILAIFKIDDDEVEDDNTKIESERNCITVGREFDNGLNINSVMKKRLQQRVRWRRRQRQQQQQQQERLLFQLLQQQQQEQNQRRRTNQRFHNNNNNNNNKSHRNVSRSGSFVSTSSSLSKQETSVNGTRRTRRRRSKSIESPIEELYVQWRLHDRLSYKNLSSIGMIDQSTSSSTESIHDDDLEAANESKHTGEDDWEDDESVHATNVIYQQHSNSDRYRNDKIDSNNFNPNPSLRRSSKNYDHFETPNSDDNKNNKTPTPLVEDVDDNNANSITGQPRTPSKAKELIRSKTMTSTQYSTLMPPPLPPLPPRHSPKTNKTRKLNIIGKRKSSANVIALQPRVNMTSIYKDTIESKEANSRNERNYYRTMQSSSLSTSMLSPSSSFDRLLLEGEDITKGCPDDSDDDESDTFASTYEEIRNDKFNSNDTRRRTSDDLHEMNQPNHERKQSLTIMDNNFWLPSSDEDKGNIPLNQNTKLKETSNSCTNKIISSQSTDIARSKLSSSRSWRTSGALSTCLSPHVTAHNMKTTVGRSQLHNDVPSSLIMEVNDQKQNTDGNGSPPLISRLDNHTGKGIAEDSNSNVDDFFSFEHLFLQQKQVANGSGIASGVNLSDKSIHNPDLSCLGYEERKGSQSQVHKINDSRIQSSQQKHCISSTCSGTKSNEDDQAGQTKQMNMSDAVVLHDRIKTNSNSIGPGIRHNGKKTLLPLLLRNSNSIGPGIRNNGKKMLLQVKRFDSEAGLHFDNNVSTRKILDENTIESGSDRDAKNHLAAGLRLYKDPDQIRYRSRVARVKYNAQIMPNRIILIRHGQSMGNIDESLYSTTPDNAMPLTELGWEQAKEAGRFLRQLLSKQQTKKSISQIDESGFGSSSSRSSSFGGDIHNDDLNHGVHFILSPYVRTVETFHGIVSAWCDPKTVEADSRGENENGDERDNTRDEILAKWYNKLVKENGITWQEDPRIREQDFGNYQEPKLIQKAKKDRHRFGAFYYRFPHGESASDVFDRVSTFLDSLWRSFDANKSRNYVLVTHGISIRVILARYFRYTVDQFHLLANPRNCEMIVLEHDGSGRLELAGRYELESDWKKNPHSQSDLNGSRQIQSPQNMTTQSQVLPEPVAPKLDTANNIKEHKPAPGSYRYHKRLRVLPRRMVREVKIRMRYDDQV